jgi:dolichol kinase
MITRVEITRKLVHLGTLVVPAGYALTDESTVLYCLVPFFFCFLLVDLLRQVHPGIASIFRKHIEPRVLREKERFTWMGATYFLFSSLLTILLFPKNIAIVSLLILILSDTAAAIVGKWIGGIRIFNKTLEGSAAFLVVALIIVWLSPKLDRLAGSLAAFGATLIELLPLGLDDNLTIPMIAGAIMIVAGG